MADQRKHYDSPVVLDATDYARQAEAAARIMRDTHERLTNLAADLREKGFKVEFHEGSMIITMPEEPPS
jgi:hypothetical protein